MLACVPVFTKHSASKLAASLRPYLEEAGVTRDNLCAVVTDEGGAAPLIASQFDANEIQCAGHLLQTALRRAMVELLRDFPVVAAIIEASKSIISHVRNSTQSRMELQNLQITLNESTNSLIQDVPTRWNSCLYSLQSLLNTKKSLFAWISISDNGSRQELFSFMQRNKDYYCDIVSDLVSLLQPVELVTRELSQEKVPTLHMTIGEIHALISTLQDTKLITPEIKQFASIICKEIKQKFMPWHDAELIAFALAPSNHAYVLPELDDGLKLISDMLKSSFPPMPSPMEVGEVPRPVSPASPFANNLAVARAALRAPTPQPIASLQIDSLYHAEVELFRNAASKTQLSLLEFWRNHQLSLPTLSKLASKYLAIPATQTASEREFSLMRCIFSHLRGNLDPTTANKQLSVAAFVRARNLRQTESSRVSRTDASIAADSLRNLKRQESQLKKAKARSADYALELPNADLNESHTVQDAEDDEILDLLLGDDGERSSDGDYEIGDDIYSDCDESCDSDDAAFLEPSAKQPKLAENTSPGHKISRSCRLITSSDDNRLILGFFSGLDGTEPLNLELIFKHDHVCFEDFKMISPDTANASCSFRLSKIGLKKFKTGRRGALFHLGEIRSF